MAGLRRRLATFVSPLAGRCSIRVVAVAGYRSPPGMRPITAAAIEAFAPPMATFKRGRDFTAWLGLVPRQHTTGGKPRLGRTSKIGTLLGLGPSSGPGAGSNERDPPPGDQHREPQ